MKYAIALIACTLTVLPGRAQTNNTTLYTYKQKQGNDSLMMLFPDLQKNNENGPARYNMPAINLLNESVLVGANTLGDVYKMETDNMLCLKPKQTNATIPNAFKGGRLTIPPKEK